MDNVIQFDEAIDGYEQVDRAKLFYKARTMWMDRLNRRKDITAQEFRVATYIAFRMNGDDQCCWPSRETISGDLGISTKTVDRCIKRLQNLGVLSKEQGRKGVSNVYRLVDTGVS